MVLFCKGMPMQHLALPGVNKLMYVQIQKPHNVPNKIMQHNVLTIKNYKTQREKVGETALMILI